MKNRPSGLTYKTSQETLKTLISEIKNQIRESQTGKILLNFKELGEKYNFSDRGLRNWLPDLRKIFNFERTRTGFFVSFNSLTGKEMTEQEGRIYGVLRGQALGYPVGLVELCQQFPDLIKKEVTDILITMADKGIIKFFRSASSDMYRSTWNLQNFKKPFDYKNEKFHGVVIPA